MPIDRNRVSFRNEINQLNNMRDTSKQIEYIDALDIIRQDNKFKEQLEEIIELDSNKKEFIEKDINYLKNKKQRIEPIIRRVVTNNEFNVIGYDNLLLLIKDIIEDISGMSVIAPLFETYENFYDDVTNIYILSWDTIFYDKRDGTRNIQYDKPFLNESHYIQFLERIAREANTQAADNGEHKIVDFALYGNRFQMLSSAIAPLSPSLTIRLHSDKKITKEMLIEQTVATKSVMTYLGNLIKGEGNMIIAGVTGSGKTTTLEALVDGYITNKRILSCQDTRELRINNKHTLDLVTSKGVTLRDTVILSLRQNPEVILVGEVRDTEAEALIEAMNTGHFVLTTMHSDTAIGIINRLVEKYTKIAPSLTPSIVERIIATSLQFIVIQKNVRNRGRKIHDIVEVSYDYEKQTVILKQLVKYDYKTDSFKFTGKISKEKADRLLENGASEKFLTQCAEEEKL